MHGLFIQNYRMAFTEDQETRSHFGPKMTEIMDKFKIVF